MYTEPLKNRIVLPLEKWTNAIFSQKYNPFYYHGALPNFFIWTCFLTGLLLFAYYTPTLERAHETLSYITFQLPFGNLIRSMHRYAADGMMIFVMIHMVRVWFTDRFREYRILPWVTGVVLLAITFFVGLSGYLLIWDNDGVMLTNVTVNLTRQIPLVGPALAQFLIGGDIVTDYTLTKFLFLHLAIPVLLMFFLWMHYLRITRPVTNAPVPLVFMMLGAVILFSGIFPVGLGDKVTDLHQLVSAQSNHVVNIDLDLLYAWPQWLWAKGWNDGLVLLLFLSVPVVLLILPYIQKKSLRDQFAKVAAASCTGCSLCYNDCPYEAITMVDRQDESRFKRLAVVDPARCANCGLCVGACAFKAIEIPRRDTTDVLEEINLALAT